MISNSDNNPEINEQSNLRDASLDSLRGIAVILMILGHAIYYFHNSSNTLLMLLEKSANTVVFTAFLFIFGAANYIGFIRHNDKNADRTKQLLKRAIIILFCFYIVAITGALSEIKNLELNTIVPNLLQILILSKVSSFTEFLLPFFFYLLTLPVLKNFYQKIAKNLSLNIFTFVVAYFLGTILFTISMPGQLNVYKAILSGNEGLLRFPLLQYFPVFALGIYWGNLIVSGKTKMQFTKEALKFGVTFAAGSIIAFLISTYFSLALIDPQNRWPPSLGFISVGMFFVYAGLILYFQIPKPKWTNKFWQFLIYLGRDSLDLYESHIILLFFYARFIGLKFSGFVIVILMYLILLVISIIISSLNWKVSPSIFNLGAISFNLTSTRRVKKRYVFSTIILISILFLLMNNKSVYSPLGQEIKKTDITNIMLINGETKEIENKTKISINRHWFLKSVPESVKPETELEIMSEPTNENTTAAEYYYEISSTGLSGKINGVYGNNKFIRIPISQLPTGNYNLNIYNYENNKSQQPLLVFKIFVSEPLYVGMTLDWEGWDTPISTLEQIDILTQKHHNLPLTHFFNPRVFISTSVDKKNTEQLVTWILNRTSISGDEIALHLHGFYDEMESAGIIPKKTLHWGYKSNDGYDVPLTAYSQSDFETLINWSLREFSQNGLPIPQGFRAGGWFENSAMLESLNRIGFAYDSSGRENKLWNINNRSPWNLTPITKPYYPEKTNQNQPGDGQNMLLEIPNNGGNTYEYNQNDLINRFKDNFNDSPLNSKQSIVFLSHPQWSNTEFPKINTVLNYVDKYRYEDDQGPVIYVPLYTIYLQWKK
jgi:uncharacterized membrane protein